MRLADDVQQPVALQLPDFGVNAVLVDFPGFGDLSRVSGFHKQITCEDSKIVLVKFARHGSPHGIFVERGTFGTLVNLEYSTVTQKAVNGFLPALLAK
jgi:hypothetical protein